jgi:hypothetical protein
MDIRHERISNLEIELTLGVFHDYTNPAPFEAVIEVHHNLPKDEVEEILHKAGYYIAHYCEWVRHLKPGEEKIPW